MNKPNIVYIFAEDLTPETVLPDCTRRACEFIRRQSEQERPFLLYFPLSAPHTPILPESFSGMSGTNPYGDFCLMVDWCVGEVMKAVEHTGKAAAHRARLKATMGPSIGPN